MKRSIRDSLHKAPAAPAEKPPENAEAVIERYSGMSESELMSALMAETSRQRAEGTFDESSIKKGMEALAPMLGEDQMKRLREILSRL